MTKKHKNNAVLQTARSIDVKLLIGIAIVVALAGGFMVYQSFAMAKYKKPTNVDCASYAVLRVGDYSVTCARISVPNAPHRKPRDYSCSPSKYYRKAASGVVVTCRRR